MLPSLGRGASDFDAIANRLEDFAVGELVLDELEPRPGLLELVYREFVALQRLTKQFGQGAGNLLLIFGAREDVEHLPRLLEGHVEVLVLA